ncbi:patatin-like protein 2 [Camellia sinensis]|uniref:patatin-like protein 2 n=1 Tax=Camellia sinensis TaxID=4442 RepID=UPI001035F869|nr:patatin-like protein 2 [Camellia sinensis]
MFTAPNENNCPVFAAKDIKDFYFDNCPKILPQTNNSLFSQTRKAIKALSRPKYDRKYLREVVKEDLGETKLHQTLTNIAIPTFDIKTPQPTIFSTYEVNYKPTLDALLSDICIATSAAPTYLSAHSFKIKDPTGTVREFNLIDGGVVANNLLFQF